VLRLPADTTDSFFGDEKAILSSLGRAGERCKLEVAFTKANSSCLSMMLGQGQGLSEKSS
jgi:hypothetical protein